jgi:hypothetical protein
VLAVDHHVLANEIGKIDAMVRAAEAHDDPRVQHAFAPHALADAGIVQQLLRAVFQHAGADTVLDIRAGTRFEYDRLDALKVQQMRQQQPGRTCPHDTNLRPHPAPPATRTVAGAAAACIIRRNPAGEEPTWPNSHPRTRWQPNSTA